MVIGEPSVGKTCVLRVLSRNRVSSWMVPVVGWRTLHHERDEASACFTPRRMMHEPLDTSRRQVPFPQRDQGSECARVMTRTGRTQRAGRGRAGMAPRSNWRHLRATAYQPPRRGLRNLRGAHSSNSQASKNSVRQSVERENHRSFRIQRCKVYVDRARSNIEISLERDADVGRDCESGLPTVATETMPILTQCSNAIRDD